MTLRTNKRQVNFAYGKVIFSVITLVVFISSCTKEVAPQVVTAECPNVISYQVDIKPLIQTHCATNLGPGTGCHDAWIFDYNYVQASVLSGEFGTDIEDRSMPKIPNDFGIVALTNDEVQTFKCWIAQGAPNN